MNVYLRAAEHLAARPPRYYSCWAVTFAETGRDPYGSGVFIASPAANAYEEAFALGRRSLVYRLNAQFRYNYHQWREWRLTALCFAAAMHDTGDL